MVIIHLAAGGCRHAHTREYSRQVGPLGPEIPASDLYIPSYGCDFYYPKSLPLFWEKIIRDGAQKSDTTGAAGAVYFRFSRVKSGSFYALQVYARKLENVVFLHPQMRTRGSLKMVRFYTLKCVRVEA